MDFQFSKVLPVMLVGIVLTCIGMLMHSTDSSVVPYIFEAVGIVLTLVFCVVAVVSAGHHPSERQRS